MKLIVMNPNIVSTAAIELRKRYDYIRMMDGIRFLKEIFGDGITVGECLKAWKAAYQ